MIPLVSLDAMAQMLCVLRNGYHGADGYLKSQCGFSDHDVATIKDNLLTSQDHGLVNAKTSESDSSQMDSLQHSTTVLE